MKIAFLVCFLAAFVLVECYHTFLGTNVQRQMAYHHDVHYSSKFLRKRVENLYFSLPAIPSYSGRSIQVTVIVMHQKGLEIKQYKKHLGDAVSDFREGFQEHFKGILAYDLTHSEASANVTQGGLGYNYVNLRMKSDRGKELHYDVYIYL